MTETTMITLEPIGTAIYTIRGRRIMLDSDIARLYGVTTARLNEQVRRNQDRFPADDFAFRLTRDEFTNLISQNAISSGGHGGRRTPPNVFTEHGAVMAAAVLNSPRAVETSVFVVRAFVRQREILLAHADLTAKLERLERKTLGGFTSADARLDEHEDRLDAYESQLEEIIEALRALMSPPRTTRRRIGFRGGEDEDAEI